MTKYKPAKSLSIGKNVRVIQSSGKSLGETLYVVSDIGEGFSCCIREVKSDGNLGAIQVFDTSLLWTQPIK